MDTIFILFYFICYLYFIGYIIYISFRLANNRTNNIIVENSDDESEIESEIESDTLTDPSTPFDSSSESIDFSEKECDGSLRQRNLSYHIELPHSPTNSEVTNKTEITCLTDYELEKHQKEYNKIMKNLYENKDRIMYNRVMKDLTKQKEKINYNSVIRELKQQQVESNEINSDETNSDEYLIDPNLNS